MCYLVTIGTRASDRLEEMIRDTLLAVRASRNLSLRSAFPKEDRLFDLTCGHCSCDLATPHAETVEQQRSRLKAKFEGKRWSKAKISRALDGWEAAHARRVAPRIQFQALLRALGAEPGGIRMVIHFYSGLFETESVKPRGRISVSAAELLKREAILPEDMLVEINTRDR